MSELPDHCKECGQLLITDSQRKFAGGLREILRESRVALEQAQQTIDLLEINITQYWDEYGLVEDSSLLLLVQDMQRRQTAGEKRSG